MNVNKMNDFYQCVDETIPKIWSFCIEYFNILMLFSSVSINGIDWPGTRVICEAGKNSGIFWIDPSSMIVRPRIWLSSPKYYETEVLEWEENLPTPSYSFKIMKISTWCSHGKDRVSSSGSIFTIAVTLSEFSLESESEWFSLEFEEWLKRWTSILYIAFNGVRSLSADSSEDNGSPCTENTESSLSLGSEVPELVLLSPLD